MNLNKVIVSLLMAFVGVMFVINITPEIETAISGASITNAFTSALVDMAEWVIPVGAIVAIFYGVFKLFGGRRGG